MLDARAVVPVALLSSILSVGGITNMMGTKVRTFAPLPDLSLEELVPEDTSTAAWIEDWTSRLSGTSWRIATLLRAVRVLTR